MIRIHANLILRVLDGFTGRPPAPSALRWTLDKMPCHPIAKADGYYVLVNLSPGPHELVLQGWNYQDERMTFEGGEQLSELLVTMKPGPRYPFGRAVTWLTIRVLQKKQPAPGQRVWIAAKNPFTELRIAQDVIRAGEGSGKLFYPESVKAMALPRDLLLIDGARSEVCRLEELEEPRFAAPFTNDHKRSCCLYPAQCHTADGEGIIRAVFREPTAVELRPEGRGAPDSIELTAGINEHTLTISKRGTPWERTPLHRPLWSNALSALRPPPCWCSRSRW